MRTDVTIDWPESVPWATADMAHYLGDLCDAVMPNNHLREALYQLALSYLSRTRTPCADQTRADAFNWACEQLGYTEDYYGN